MWKAILLILSILITGVIMFNIFSKKSSESGSENEIDITAEQFKTLRAETPGVIIDVRTKGEYDEGHLAEVDQLQDFTNGDFQAQLENLDKNETYYLYCRTGNRSGKAARLMKQKGFEHVYNVGGFNDLAESGFEIE